MSRTLLVIPLAALGLTVVFWLPLWQGGGLIGGDVYSYYLPQKVFYADSLAAGEFPLWNNRVGAGYPLIGESQTGAFYPFHLVFYRFFDINTAYNANHLLHYALAFVFAWLYARSISLNRVSAALAALVYVYGWFPPRSCWEWAIIGGTWLPAAFWCVERFLATRLWRHAIALSAVLGVQLLAGHFNIAFITLVTLMAYVPLRLWVARANLPDPIRKARGRALFVLGAAAGLGMALASVQLLPTWELKVHSQRATVGEQHKLAHGASPAGYWSQIWLPWQWYSPTLYRDFVLEAMSRPLGAKTNQVEAHLYFGLVPLGLALCGIVRAWARRKGILLLWAGLGLAAMVYGWGWLIPVTEYLPGFNFFQGPGRFGIVTTLAAGLLAAYGLELLFLGRSLLMTIFSAALIPASLFSAQHLIDKVDAGGRGARGLIDFAGLPITGDVLMLVFCAGGGIALVACLMYLAAAEETARGPSRWTLGFRALMGIGIFGATIVDLWVVSRLVTYTAMVSDPPIVHLAESPLRRILSNCEQPARVQAPMPNLASVFGASSVPVYLTFGPQKYADGWYPEPTHWLDVTSTGQRRSVLWEGWDPVLNPILGSGNLRQVLYEVEGGPARAAWMDPEVDGTVRIMHYGANSVSIEAESRSGGWLVLRDLMFPGWHVSIDGIPAQPRRVEQHFRGVDVPAGKHQVVWTYRPRSLYWGAAISMAVFVLLAAIAHVRYWHPARLRLFNEEAHP